jgi:hypothetical protein
MLYATIFVTLVVIWISLLVAHLNKNYKIASKSGLPVVVTPFNPDNPLWLLAGAIAYRPLSKILPPSWFVRIKPTCYGWEFKDRGDELSIHDLVGESFFVVTGGEVEFVTRDSGFNQIICAKHRNFVPLKQAAYVLGMQGPNILTVIITSQNLSSTEF